MNPKDYHDALPMLTHEETKLVATLVKKSARQGARGLCRIFERENVSVQSLIDMLDVHNKTEKLAKKIYPNLDFEEEEERARSKK